MSRAMNSYLKDHPAVKPYPAAMFSASDPVVPQKMRHLIPWKQIALVTLKKQAGEVVRMGPCGGGGGDAVKMDTRGVNRIVLVVVRHCNAVDAMAVVYERDGLEERTGMWGGQGGKRSEFRLKPDEYLTSVEGHYGQFEGKFVIRSLKFVSNTRTYGPYGKEDGVPFALPAAGGGKILGFHARSGVFLDAIGTYVKMDD